MNTNSNYVILQQPKIKMNSIEYNLYKFFDEFPSIEQFIECYLVKHNVRPAYLLEGCKCLGRQNTNWFSRLFSFQDNCKIHSSIRKWFPTLIETANPGFGTFISKDKISTDIIKNDDDVGRILGYPAWKGFSNLNRNEMSYAFNITITFKNVLVGEPIILITNVSANDITDEMEIIRKKIEYVLKTKPAETLFTYISEYIDTITVEKTLIYPVKYLINKLVNDEILIEEEITEIKNYIWNTENEELAEYNFDWHNKIHIGVVITLLLRNEYNELEPFYYHFRENDSNSKESIKINKQYADELIKILDNSRITHHKIETNSY